MHDNISEAIEVLKKSKHSVAFTGAGISVESGIPPFRGEGGLWGKYDPKVLDLEFFFANPLESWTAIKKIFYEFFGAAQANNAHKVLARMEAEGKLHSVITQNIDNLHQEAGSKVVHEFHGNSKKLVCTKCGKTYSVNQVDFQIPIPSCGKDGALLKPDFIFFGESIPEQAYIQSFAEAENAEVFVLIGTTGEVMPASMVPQIAKKNGVKIIEINPNPSLYTTEITDIYLKGKASDILLQIEKGLFEGKQKISKS